MPNTARAHHYVPEAMLAGFTNTGKKDGKIWVCDLVTKKEWATRPKNVAHRRDLYAVDIEGVSSDFVEQRLLSPVESAATEVIRRIEQTRSFPLNEDAIQSLLFFIALLSTRVPLARIMVDETVNRFLEAKMAEMLKTSEKWEAVLQEMHAMGIDITGMGYSEMQEHASNMRFRATQHFQIQIMFEGAVDILPELRKRAWSLAESMGGNLICSDRPVILAFGAPPPWASYPGFALPNTDVYVPLTRHILLRGMWPTRQIQSRMLTHKGVARFNSLILDRAERYVFSSTNDFPWMDRSRAVQHGARDLPRKSDKPVVRFK